MSNHIFIPTNPDSYFYTSPSSGGGSQKKPHRNRHQHAQYLKGKLSEILKVDEEKLTVTSPVRDGTYLEFTGSPNHLLNIKSLENLRSGIKLLNSRIEKIEGIEINKATVYIPKGKEDYFLKRIQEYEEKETPKGNPKHQGLIDTIEDVDEALLEAFWIGEKKYMPDENPYWCELWIRDDHEEDVLTEVQQVIRSLGIEMKDDKVEFSERVIILIKANRKQLAKLIVRSDFIAEIRRATEANTFFLGLENKEQIEWAEDLVERLEIDESDVVVSVLDTGLNNGNILLSPIISEEDIHSHFTDKGHDSVGHGTAMGGIATYGDLKGALESDTNLVLSHSLESMKILPDNEANEPELFGAITAQSISQLYIEAPERKRVICMAVTAPDYTSLNGHPSSWSAAIDDLIHGTLDEIPKVFLVSAGNIRDPHQISSYPDGNLVETVEDPAQSWNAITVGAYTNLDSAEDDSYEVIAQKGELSPFSRSSLLFENSWPIKPEIVLEGGNAIRIDDVGYTEENLSLLTTSHNPTDGTFTTMNATSAATASAAWMAAKIQTTYPEAWSETVRALLIHSAEWTEEMEAQFITGKNKSDYRNILRTCGYGVPSLERALDTVNNRVSLIVQSELQPFDKVDGEYKTNEMHIHDLPWPREELLAMAETEVELKVTLSYFIEPGPGEKGWKDRYRYPSSGLRFDLNGTSDKESFLNRINKAARDEQSDKGSPSGADWKLGVNNRDVGSIHSDTWIGSAAELATSNYIGVYPVIGWWRERHHLGKWDYKVRYSLIVTLSTPKSDVDLLTPIQTEIATRIAAEIEVDI